MKMRMVIGTLVLCVVAMSTQASTILLGAGVNNGSFESPDLVGIGTAEVVIPTGWKSDRADPVVVTQTDGTVFGGGTYTETAHDGDQFVVPCSSGPEGVYQDQDTLGTFQANTVYTLTGYGSWTGFLQSGYTQNDAVLQMRLGASTAAGAYVSNLPYEGIFAFTAFPTLTIDTSVDTSLVGSPIVVMLYTNGGDLYPRFDDITLTATEVPEPTTLALIGLGSLFLRRRK